MSGESTQNTGDEAARSAGSGAAVFRAVLHPHRSLSRRGFRMIMGGVGLVSVVLGVLFLAQGAWPIFGFLGLDVLLLWWALSASNRSGRMYETVELTPAELKVERVDPRRRVRRWTFQPYWLRVSMDDPPRHESHVTLSTHGQSLVVGAFLTPAERLEFATELRRALDQVRQPAHLSTT